MNWEDPTTWPEFSLCQTAKDIYPRGGQVIQQKLDGVRVMASCHDLKMRNTQMQHSGLLRATDGNGIPKRCVLDGELVADDEEGPGRVISLLAGERWEKLIFMPFDMVCYLTIDITPMHLWKRMSYLRKLGYETPDEQWIKNPQDIPTDWEGVVLKGISEQYISGRGNWVKYKPSWTIELYATQARSTQGHYVLSVQLVTQNNIATGHATIPNEVLMWAMYERDPTEQEPVRVKVKHFGVTKHGHLKNAQVIEIFPT